MANSKKNKLGIYQIRNIINNKVYIGSTSDFKRREKDHLHDLEANKHHSYHLQKSYNKYGKDNFIFEILEEIKRIENEDELKNILIKREQHWLDKIKSHNIEIGYNISPTASISLGIKRTPEFKEKIRITSLGRKHTEESKLKCKTRCKLTTEEVIQIKTMLKNGEKQIDIANKFNVNSSVISNIKSGRRWNNVETQDVSNDELNKIVYTLKENEVKEIIKMVILGIDINNIMIKFNTAKQNILNIINKKTWKYLTKNIIFNFIYNYKKRILTEYEVLEIKKLLSLNKKGIDIARKLNVQPDVVSRIKTGKSWSHVKLEDQYV